MDCAAGHLSGKASETGVGPNHILHGKSYGSRRHARPCRNRFEMFKECWTLIPRHPLASVDDIIPFQRADRDCQRVRNIQLPGKAEKIALQAVEGVFSMIDQIHLVHGSQHIRNPQQGRDVRVPPGLWKQAFRAVN